MRTKKFNTISKDTAKIGALFCVMALLFLTMPTMVYATNEYAESAAKWFLDGVFWVVLVFGIVGAGMSAVKRNTTAALGIILATALVCTVCQNPEIITNLGTKLKDIIGL